MGIGTACREISTNKILILKVHVRNVLKVKTYLRYPALAITVPQRATTSANFFFMDMSIHDKNF